MMMMMMMIRTATDSKQSAMTNVPTQLTTLATATAFGRGRCRNSSAPIIRGIGPASHAVTERSVNIFLHRIREHQRQNKLSSVTSIAVKLIFAVMC